MDAGMCYTKYYLVIYLGDDMPSTHPVAVKLDQDVHARVRELAKAQH